MAGIVVLVLALLGGIGAWLYARNLNNDLARTDPFAEITGGRPAKTVDGALNILLVGSDSRDRTRLSTPRARGGPTRSS